MSTEYDVNCVNNCPIIPLDEYNMSDHLPIRMSIYIDVPIVNDSGVNLQHKRMQNGESIRTNWGSHLNNANYATTLSSMLHNLPTLHVDPTGTENCNQSRVDNYVNN